MSTYKTLVDFRLFNHADMWEACKGFRSVIHKAIYTADVELAALLRGHLQQLLDIDEDNQALVPKGAGAFSCSPLRAQLQAASSAFIPRMLRPHARHVSGRRLEPEF